ncbi:MAG TPA: hypothetical protein VGK92_02180 [Gaiellales bacterium]
MSVAGLIALGPLTDSLGSQVTFRPSISTASTGKPKQAQASVPVSIELHKVGTVETAALHSGRGGHAKTNASSVNSTDGAVALKVHSAVTTTHAATSTSTSTTTHKAATATTKPKKAPKRQTSLGGISETNGDQGLAAPGTQTSPGEQSSTPAP